MWVIFTHNITNYPCRLSMLFVMKKSTIVHRIQYPSMNIKALEPSKICFSQLS